MWGWRERERERGGNGRRGERDESQTCICSILVAEMERTFIISSLLITSGGNFLKNSTLALHKRVSNQTHYNLPLEHA